MWHSDSLNPAHLRHLRQIQLTTGWICTTEDTIYPWLMEDLHAGTILGIIPGVDILTPAAFRALTATLTRYLGIGTHRYSPHGLTQQTFMDALAGDYTQLVAKNIIPQHFLTYLHPLPLITIPPLFHDPAWVALAGTFVGLLGKFHPSADTLEWCSLPSKNLAIIVHHHPVAIQKYIDDMFYPPLLRFFQTWGMPIPDNNPRYLYGVRDRPESAAMIIVFAIAHRWAVLHRLLTAMAIHVSCQAVLGTGFHTVYFSTQNQILSTHTGITHWYLTEPPMARPEWLAYHHATIFAKDPHAQFWDQTIPPINIPVAPQKFSFRL